MPPSITMTGTINPDGTVGPVGGIPEKIAGLAEQGFGADPVIVELDRGGGHAIDHLEPARHGQGGRLDQMERQAVAVTRAATRSRRASARSRRRDRAARW